MITVDGIPYILKVIIPAGRRRYCELLSRYIESERDIYREIDSVEWMLLTDRPEDLEFLHEISRRRPDLHRTWYDPRWRPPFNPDNLCWSYIAQGQDRLGRDPNTVYVRLDDDIVYLSEHLIGRLGEAMVRNSKKNILLTFPFILNNGRMLHMLGETGLIGRCKDQVYNEYIDRPELAYDLHRSFIERKLDPAIISKSVPSKRWRDPGGISVNCISWVGSNFTNFRKTLQRKDAEENELVVGWLEDCPEWDHFVDPDIGTVCHFSFWKQRSYLDGTDLLDLYRKFCDVELQKRASSAKTLGINSR